MALSNRRKAVLWIAAFFGIVSISFAAVEKPLFDYHESNLANGLNVVTLEDFSCPIVAVQVWYQVGSKDERPDRQGYAHLFEHMMFKGTDHVGPKDHFDLIHRTGGSSNAHTGFDQTVYEETLPADQLDLALWLEAERMAFLKIDQESFDTERKVVEEELRMRENEPYGNLDKKLAAIVFKEHPYRWMPIGNLADLRATSVADLRAFWQRYYIPDNATLIVVGAVKHDHVVRLAEKYFGWIQKRDLPTRVAIREPLQDKPSTTVIDNENAPAPLAGFIFRTVPLVHKDAPALDFLASVLGGTSSSRLYRDLVAEKQLAMQTIATGWNLQQDGVFILGAVFAPGSDPNVVLEKIKSHIETIQKQEITEEELQTARNQQLRSVVTSNLEIDSKAGVLGTAAVTVGDLSYANKILSQIRAVTAQDVLRVAREYLRLDRAFAIVVRENPGGMKNASKDNESAAVTAKPETQAPPPGRPDEKRPDSFPNKAPQAKLQAPDMALNYTEQTLKNGLKIMVVSNREVPFVSVKLGFTLGAATESKPGTVNLAAQMLNRGTKSRTEKDLSEQLSRYAIEVNGSASMDDTQVNMSCLSEHLDKAMELLADVTINPIFDPGEFEKLRKQTLTGLAVQEQNPEYLAGREFSRQLFGRHPYARTVEATSKDIQQLSAQDLNTWWKLHIGPAGATLIFAGDIELQQAAALAEKYFGDWKRDAAIPETKMPDFPPQQKTRICLVDYPGSAQVQIRIGCRSMTRKDQPDYFISRVVSNYFGISFNSWINETLRVQKGLTYSAFANYTAQRQSGYFEINTFTKNQSAAQAVQCILDLLNRLRREKPSDQELDSSKSYISGSFIRRRETPQQTAGDLWQLKSENLDNDYYDKLVRTVQNTSAQDCVTLAQKTLAPEKLAIVVVGDASVIKTDLEKIAPVTVVSGK
jgi:zinc protease